MIESFEKYARLLLGVNLWSVKFTNWRRSILVLLAYQGHLSCNYNLVDDKLSRNKTCLQYS